jgi:hypothetical protein
LYAGDNAGIAERTVQVFCENCQFYNIDSTNRIHKARLGDANIIGFALNSLPKKAHQRDRTSRAAPVKFAHVQVTGPSYDLRMTGRPIVTILAGGVAVSSLAGLLLIPFGPWRAASPPPGSR